jgi:hypothetical protein
LYFTPKKKKDLRMQRSLSLFKNEPVKASNLVFGNGCSSCKWKNPYVKFEFILWLSQGRQGRTGEWGAE